MADLSSCSQATHYKYIYIFNRPEWKTCQAVVKLPITSIYIYIFNRPEWQTCQAVVKLSIISRILALICLLDD